MSTTLAFWALSNAFAVIALCVALGLYSMLFSSVGFPEAFRLLIVSSVIGVGNLAFVLITRLAGVNLGIGYSVVIFYTMLLFIGLSALRFSKRLYRAVKTQVVNLFSKQKRVMLVGCNNDSLTLIKNINMNKKSLYKAVCIIDPNEEYLGKRLVDTRVVGALEDIKEVAKKYRIQEIFVAIPSQKKGLLAEILSYCKDCGCPIRLLPELSKMTNGEITVSKLRPVKIEDLLGREQVSVNLHEVMGYIEGKVVLVTGGGGSIGSELCRQIASHNPAQLIILDIYENNAYEIEQELKRHCPNLNLLTLIASIRDKVKVRDVFEKYRPQIVFNAAAHKHVPLMETSPNEAVKNNVFGTLNLAKAAEEFHVETFVQISTDKAVNPTNIMGATKRICEMIIQNIGKNSKYTNFVAVRFGNVLGSNGSVIPLFNKQNEEVGPDTVTH
ncbi:MAG: polysaccharide biosynthesis protein, partial [Clostridia bacterium]|nr:polysaccharide biosynthesis protein [Clostridia bacterium]